MNHPPLVPASPDPALSDPMFRALRLHHPDVDIVLLPPEPVHPPDLPPAAEGECRTLQGHARAALDAIGEHLAVGPDGLVGLWWRQSHPLVHRWVVRCSFVAADGDARTLLRRTGQRLVDLGWDARPAVDGSPRLRAVTEHLEVLAGAEGEALSVQVSTRPLHVPDTLMESLVGRGEPGDE